jgi:hypothetical protein
MLDAATFDALQLLATLRFDCRRVSRDGQDSLMNACRYLLGERPRPTHRGPVHPPLRGAVCS